MFHSNLFKGANLNAVKTPYCTLWEGDSSFGKSETISTNPKLQIQINRFTFHYSRFTIHTSQPTTHNQQPTTNNQQPFTIHILTYSQIHQFTIPLPFLLFTLHASLLTSHYSLLTIHLFTLHASRFTLHASRFTTHN